MAFGVGCSRSESHIVPLLYKKKEQPQQQAKKGYWQNELYPLGILEPNAKKNLTIIKKNFACEAEMKIVKRCGVIFEAAAFFCIETARSAVFRHVEPSSCCC
jgi:hypothetical protein